MTEPLKFLKERQQSITNLGLDDSLKYQAKNFIRDSHNYKYTYNFDWLGLPIIQLPQDIVAIQEIIWKTKPNIIIETGIAHGGSLILSASILHLLNGNGKVIGIDIEIRPHNRKAIEEHPLYTRIKLLEGSSTDHMIFDQVRSMISPNDKVMVILDSNHAHDHVLKELKLYSTLVSKDAYLIVMDTLIEDLPDLDYSNRPWGIGNNPKTAVKEFLKNNDEFEIDHDIQHKMIMTVCPDGYLKRAR